MPRQNRPRTVFAEEHVARNIAVRMKAEGWSYDGLAKRMADVGCAMDQSAIYKILKAQPRRRITVDELVAFSRVLDRSLDQLVADPELAEEKSVLKGLAKWSRMIARQELQAAEHERERGDLQQSLLSTASASERLFSLISSYLMEPEGPPSSTPAFAQPSAATRERDRGKRRTSP